jgi:filamentous hemagglutinin family protein
MKGVEGSSMRRSQKSNKFRQNRTWSFLILGAVVVTSPQIAFSNPQDPNVAAGKASFNQVDPNTLQITTDDRAVINWKSFSIDQGERTQFIQPGKDSAVLNRVTGGDLSSLLGNLEANGKVYLINPNGVIFGKDSVINTASFIASALDTLDDAFMQGKDLVFSGDSQASILHLGKITAENGDVVLIGYYVDQKGEINAPNGVASIAAGSEVVLKLEGDQRISIRPKMTVETAHGTGIAQASSTHCKQSSKQTATLILWRSIIQDRLML